jgi:hypothetical protein
VASERWTDELLDSLRQQADPAADQAVAAYFKELERQDGPPDQLLRRLALGEPDRANEDANSHIRAFLDQTVEVPAWVDLDKVAQGQELFARLGSHVFTALYAAALPSAYACWRGVEVLAVTARLVTDTKRRLNETAQFHLDVMVPGGLDPRAQGYDDVRHVRLMHGAVRWLVAHDPRVTWDAVLGVPINQEDLLETLLTFTEIVFEVFDRTGVEHTLADDDAYLHVWSLIGFLLGVRPDLLPLTRADTELLMPIVRRRQYGASEAGRVLTAALLDQARRITPAGLRGLAATTVRFYIGDETADLLAVPSSDWTRLMFGPLARLTKMLSAERAHRRLLARFSNRAGLALLQLAIDAGRSGGRPPFAVPTVLADRWGVSVTGAPRGRALGASRPTGSR